MSLSKHAARPTDLGFAPAMLVRCSSALSQQPSPQVLTACSGVRAAELAGQGAERSLCTFTAGQAILWWSKVSMLGHQVCRVQPGRHHLRLGGAGHCQRPHTCQVCCPPVCSCPLVAAAVDRCVVGACGQACSFVCPEECGWAEA